MRPIFGGQPSVESALLCALGIGRIVAESAVISYTVANVIKRENVGVGGNMSVTIQISENIAQHLTQLIIGQATEIDQKLSSLLQSEYRRRLARYRLTDLQLQQKYGMTFAEFEQQRMTEQQNYSWEVESDAIVWETAVDGMETIQRQLTDLLYANN